MKSLSGGSMVCP